MDAFTPAIQAMDERGSMTYGPQAWASYQSNCQMTNSSPTAALLSVDNRARLRPSLRESGTMVLRLGSPKGERGTWFGLVRSPNGLDDYFLDHKDLFGDVEEEVFLPRASRRQLFVHELLPRATETSMVNYALASGAMHRALCLDDQPDSTIPATGQSTYSFTFRPHSDINAEWPHTCGQVEIDAIFLGRRGGKEILFVVEAKSDRARENVAKHKLAYPVLALAGSVPKALPVHPVYLNCRRDADGMLFEVCECHMPDPRTATVGLNELQPQTQRRLRVLG